ncbi:MAG: DUF1731 domain-containing protein [Chitinophagaceae bacterium]|nr:MAG: DUF1731 domain-containing protein [Chitinophagaceae bacterium]
MFSWIHKTDLCRIIGFVFRRTDFEGTLNVAAPNPVTNAGFMSALRKATGHGFGLPAYSWMLRLGAMLIGTETELVLKSRWVIPGRLLDAGFVFQYPVVGEAFREIIAQVPPKQYRLSGR